MPFPLGFDVPTFEQRRGGSNGVNYAGVPPAAYAPFAELTTGNPRSDFIDYTGISLRAFLPVSSQSARQSVRNYTGYTTIINTTTLCVRPPLTDFSVSYAPDPQFLNINVTTDATKLSSQLDKAGLKIGDFFDNRFSEEDNVNQYSAYSPSQKFSGTFSCTISTDSIASANPNSKEMVYMCSLGGVRAFAFVNMTISGASIATDIATTLDWWKVTNTTGLDASGGGAWTSLAYQGLNRTWWVSLCATTIEPQYQDVNIWSESPLVEKILTTDNQTKALDTTNLLQWLGASKEEFPYLKRSVLGLDQKSDWTVWAREQEHQPSTGTVAMSRPLAGNPMGPYYKDGQMTYQLCTTCIGRYTDNLAYLHPVHTKILQDSLAATGQPAKALQAFWTLVYQPYYYDNLQFYNIFDNSTYVAWTPVLVPVQWRGFTIVCCLTTAHVALVFVILAVFLRKTKYSRLHDPWLAYTQAYNGQLAEVLDDITVRGTKDPRKLLKRQGRSIDPVGLEVDVLGRAVGVRRRRNKLAELDSSDDD